MLLPVIVALAAWVGLGASAQRRRVVALVTVATKALAHPHASIALHEGVLRGRAARKVAAFCVRRLRSSGGAWPSLRHRRRIGYGTTATCLSAASLAIEPSSPATRRR